MYKDRFTGLYHTQYREYDPVHGRWLSIDPAGYRDGLNLYAAYMGVNGIDPLGLAEGDWWDPRTYINPVARTTVDIAKATPGAVNDYVIQPSWTGIKWTGRKGYNFSYGTGLHLYEFGYSPIRSTGRMWNTKSIGV